ncbi:MAG: MFS transporter [Acidobacteria bacterium]|nr:MFS transporter [Acidobacteriota bacterium]
MPQPAHDSRTTGERVRRRVTRRVMPFLFLLYFFAFIDRINVGVAKLGMQREFGVFFLGYILLEVPGTLIVERWSARKWIARIMISWGVIASLEGFVGMPFLSFLTPERQFYWLRFALGAAEAGFFPGIIVYLSHWFRYEDRAKAKAFFMIGQPIAYAAGLPLSRFILEKIAWNGLAGWRWVFILEGVPSMILGFITLFYLTDWPHQAKWLPPDEKTWLMDQLESERKRKQAQGRGRILDAFREPQIGLLVAVYFFVIVGNQALFFFLPSITDAMTSMSIAARTMAAMLPYVCGFGGILLNGLWSSRTGRLRWHTAGPIVLTGVALAGSILSGDRLAPAIGFFCLAGFGAQAYLPAFWTVPTALLTRSAAAVAVGIINSLGNLGGFVGPYVFGYLRTRTGRFDSGLAFLVICLLIAGLLATRIRVPEKRS